MNSNILETHRRHLRQFLTALRSSEELTDPILEKVRDSVLEETLILERYEKTNQTNRKKRKDQVSYIRTLREFLQNDLDLHYLESIRVISAIFSPLFADRVYSKAVINFWSGRLNDLVNARAEWRAYFEYRFLIASKRFHKEHLSEHWLTINFNLFSFLEEANLPVYRMHLGVPDRHHPNYKNDVPLSPYAQREEAFNSLAQFQGKYSTVWEIVKNNVSSIFYFDKTAEKEKDTVIYEIDPDVQPGAGQVDAKYVGMFVVDESHREISLLEKAPAESPEQIFADARRRKTQEAQKERAYQYGIIRFFIRAGIFNPQDAAYHIRIGEPRFEDILKISFDKLEQMRKSGENCHPESVGERKVYEQMLFAELSNVQLKTLQAVAGNPEKKNPEGQFKSSQTPERRPKKDKASSQWRNFDYAEKYSKAENEALDKVIALIDLVKPDAINVRVSLFEAGFFHLTQQDITISHVYWMPVIINWRDRETGGAAFLNSDKRIDSALKWEKDELTWENGKHGYYKDGSKSDSVPINPDLEVPQLLLTILYYLTGLFADKLIGEIEESIRPTSERAAAVSIMSRNISHNIGSHVLSYLKHLLSNEQQMLESGVLENIIQRTEDGLYFVNPDLVVEEKDGKIWIDNQATAMPYQRSIGRLIGYFQERQDYIGTFASDRYLYFSPIFFKRSVMDYFAGETPFKSADMLQNEKMHNLALDFIIYSEGYKASKDIVVKTEWIGKNGVHVPLHEKNDVEIALPSGNTGRQGIFTILENFIRNSAKHGQPKKDRPKGQMEITVTLSEDDKDYYKLQLKDNSNKTTQKVVDEIQEVLDKPLLRTDGTPDERHKGIKEIQIAAAWLRGIHPHQLLDKEAVGGERKIVTVKNLEGSLQYTLYLRKPKPGLLLVKDTGRYFETGKDGEKMLKQEYALSLAHWDIFPLADPRGINRDQISYRFVLLHEELANADQAKEEQKYQEIQKRCPVRWLPNITDEFLQQPDLTDAIYRRWLDTPYKFSKTQAHRFDLVEGSDILPSELTIQISDSDKNIPEIAQTDPLLTKKVLVTSKEVKDAWVSGDPANEPRILFRDHNDLPNKFDELCSDDPHFDQYVFIEGISGSNSTDRLIRHEKIDHTWRYKMIEAALTKIIIIDERIWNNNLGSTDKERARNQLRWEKKNIFILSLEYDPENDDLLCIKDLCQRTIITVDRDGHSRFTSEEFRKTYQKSHFISFHQGLLERVLKHCSESLGNKSEEQQVEEVFKAFRKEVLQARFRVLIHSGRSKTHIMPAPTAFVQLSALGSALRDCKLTLCELFYSTILENSDK